MRRDARSSHRLRARAGATPRRERPSAPRGSSQMASPTATKSAPAATSGAISARLAANPTQGTVNSSAHHSMRSTIASNGGRRCPAVGLAEHHVVRAAFAREHRVVAAVHAAAAGDRAGLRLSTAAMNASIPVRCAPSAPARAAISACPSSTSAMSLLLHERGQHLDAVDQVALARGLEPKQHRGDVGRRERVAERAGKRRRVLDDRRDEIEPRGGAFGLAADCGLAMAFRCVPNRAEWGRFGPRRQRSFGSLRRFAARACGPGCPTFRLPP